MPFSSLAEVVIFIVLLTALCFLLKPLQQSIEKFFRRVFRRAPKQDDIIDVTPSNNKKESK